MRNATKQAVQPTAATAIRDGTHLLVVIDHRQARVYKTELSGSVPQRVTPIDTNGTGRHLHEVERPEVTGKRKPEHKEFYEDIARTLRDADEVLLFGSGTGASSAMNQLVAEFRKNHADLAKRIVRTIVVDEHHLTEGQLLAKARAFYAERYSTTPTPPAVEAAS